MLIGETVYRLVTDIVGKAEIDADCLSRRASAAAALIAECDNARTLCVNPDDFPLLEGLRTSLLIEGDASLARGEIRIDCSAGWIEHGTSLYLDALRSGRALQRPQFNIHGLCRADLMPHLPGPSPSSLTRRIRRLRVLGLLKRVAGTYRYYLTRLGRQAIAASCALTEFILVPALANAKV